MRRIVVGAVVAVLGAGVAAVPTASAGTSHPHARAHTIPGTTCTVFPADNVWHAKINKLPVDPHSTQWVGNIGRGDNLHPDFGPSYGAQPVPYGIPVTVVSGSHPKVHVKFLYSPESDHVGYPLGADTKIEGGKNAGGDRHAIMVDKATCRLYETWLTRKKDGHWTAGSGATWSLNSDTLRHNRWTSADAAGLAILPGLVRWDEVKSGLVDHAIRFTAPYTSRHYLWPARHEAGNKKSLAYPPMGARFRLKAAFSEKGYSHYAKVVIQAMKTYGLILADNGSSWYFQGDASRGWPDNLISQLKSIPARDFVAVDESSLMISPNSAQAR
jgi:hypothetical protein